MGLDKFRRHAVGIVEIKIRSGGHSQNLAVFRVHHNGGAAFRVPFLDGLVKGVFGNHLNVAVDGQHQILALNGLFRRSSQGWNVLLVGVFDVIRGAVFTAEPAVVGALNTGHAIVVVVGKAENIGSKIAVGVIALVTFLQNDAVGTLDIAVLVGGGLTVQNTFGQIVIDLPHNRNRAALFLCAFGVHIIVFRFVDGGANGGRRRFRIFDILGNDVQHAFIVFDAFFDRLFQSFIVILFNTADYFHNVVFDGCNLGVYGVIVQ